MKNFVNPRIAAIVVTYNRKDLLVNSLAAINNQSCPPEIIYVVDNASTDGTEEMIKSLKLSVPINYLKLKSNSGGAGGFYAGLKAAHESNKYDAFWLMDDDGEPSENCLKILSHNLKDCDFCAPVCLDINDRKSISFPLSTFKNIEDLKNEFGVSINNYANPFNGILLSKDLVDSVGYPKKEMFIWGDEYEYQTRAKAHGFIPIMYLDAVHYHPKDRMQYKKDFRGHNTIVCPDSDLRKYCKYRNHSYTIWNYNRKELPWFIFKHSVFFLFQKHDLKSFNLFVKATYHGITNNFNHTFDYN